VRFLVFLVAAIASCAHGRRVDGPENRLDCAGPHTLADSANGRLQGNVSDASDERPLDDVSVTIQSRSLRRATQTDARGHWLVGDLPEGEYVVFLQRGARTIYSTSVHLCPEDVLTLRTPLWRP